MKPRAVVPETESVIHRALQAGLDVAGVAPAEAFTRTKADLEVRKAAGLHGGMAFTYRRPERSTDPTFTLPSAQALIVGALAYYRGAPSPASEAVPARIARYSWSDHYEVLRTSLREVASWLKLQGWKAVVVADDNALVDREAAYQAGLGWYGKNANLLLPGQGSWFVLGSIITNAPLIPTGPPMESACGTCERCVDACPTGAIVAPGVVDARRCLAWLIQAPDVFPLEHRVALGDRIYGCDDCQEVCPPNRSAERKGKGQAQELVRAQEAAPWADLLEMLELDDQVLLERFGRWYINSRNPVYLRRNALVALGNVAQPGDPRVRQALINAACHQDSLVVAHAVWAARRLGLFEAVAHLLPSDDELVEAELGYDVAMRDDLT